MHALPEDILVQSQSDAEETAKQGEQKLLFKRNASNCLLKPDSQSTETFKLPVTTNGSRFDLMPQRQSVNQ